MHLFSYSVKFLFHMKGFVYEYVHYTHDLLDLIWETLDATDKSICHFVQV